jgi:MSHA pilin protein MshA
MYNRKKQQGFTLIELVVVIVILGVLAVTAAPKFINISADANVSVLKAMGGAILSGASQIHAKSIIKGVQNEPLSNLDLDGDGNNDVEIKYGYPSASRNGGISQIMGGNFATEWSWSTTYLDTQFWLTTASLADRPPGSYVNQTAVRNSGCYILYNPVTSLGGTPTISYVTTDC